LEEYFGYTDLVARRLAEAGVRPGDLIEVTREDGATFRGMLMPKDEFSAPGIVVIKLDNGYNVGVRLGPKATVRLLSRGELTSHPGEPVSLSEQMSDVIPPTDSITYR